MTGDKLVPYSWAVDEYEALRELHRIGEQYGQDAYSAHQLAEAVLLRMVPVTVATQYVALKQAVGFNY